MNPPAYGQAPTPTGAMPPTIAGLCRPGKAADGSTGHQGAPSPVGPPGALGAASLSRRAAQAEKSAFLGVLVTLALPVYIPDVFPRSALTPTEGDQP